MSLVSVIVPLYNAEAFILKTLESILQENTVPLEIIVVNDRSSDRSEEIVQTIKDPRVKIISGLGQGISAALNLGLAEAKGDIIMRCDADDLYSPKRLAQQFNWLSKHPEFSAVCGSFCNIDVKGKLVSNLNTGQNAEEITEELLNGITRTHLCTFAVRSDILRASGGFREYFETAEDLDLQLRLAELGRVWYVPEIQYCYRLHDLSITHTQATVRRKFFESIASEFQRQRKERGSDDLQQGCPPNPPEAEARSATNASEHIQNMLIGRAWQEYKKKQRLQALATGLRSIFVSPGKLNAWRSFIALVFKVMTYKFNIIGN